MNRKKDIRKEKQSSQTISNCERRAGVGMAGLTFGGMRVEIPRRTMKLMMKGKSNRFQMLSKYTA